MHTHTLTDEHCLYEAARIEAENYGRQVAARNGSSFGDAAISEWNRLHWWHWVCDRVLEHVRGDVFWAELDGTRFAAYRNANGDFHQITDEIEALRDQLTDGLDAVPFRERQQLENRLANLVNRLLD